MEADWEVEIGGGAPVIEAFWPGFVGLRGHPERVGEIAEAAAFPPLGVLLKALNGPSSGLWTAKCDYWENEGWEAGCYVDVLPVEGRVFACLERTEAFCREWVARLDAARLPGCRAELIVRVAIAAEVEGYGVTAYLGAEGRDRSAARRALGAAMAALAAAIPHPETPEQADSKLQ
jgi:hypothetical protein